MRDALFAWLDAMQRGGDPHAAVVAAAERVAARPWDVVRYAGLLARCRVARAERDLGLSAALRPVGADSQAAVARVPAGAPYPVPDHAGRRSRGAFDTPVEMARRVVGAAIGAYGRVPRTGLDPACGTGAFLVAMAEAGVADVFGADLDDGALAVARVACPRARLTRGDALHGGPTAELVVGNPPFVPPERQDKAIRAELRRRFPWLEGRFDLVVPFAAIAVDRCERDGVVGLVLPSPALVQPYGAVLRRRWVQRHRVVELSGPHPFPGASVEVALIVMRVDDGPGPLPAFGITPAELLRLDAVPLDPDLMPGDVDLVERIRARSLRLGDLCVVDTGLVAHGPAGENRDRLVSDEPGPGRVPYADARDFFLGKHRWMAYRPKEMHRPKSPALFEGPKIVVQRLRGDQPVRAAVDTSGIYVGHTCTVVRPRDGRVAIDRLLELVRSPLVDGVTRIERGQRLDLYPKDVAAFPVPRQWLEDASVPLERAWGLGSREVARLLRAARR